MICVIGLGEELGDLSLAASRKLLGGGSLTLRTRACPAAAWLAENGAVFDTLDEIYEISDDFDELSRNMTKILLRKAREGDMMYAVPGGGGLEDAAIPAFLAAARREGIPAELIPGVSPRERLAFAAGGFERARALPAQFVAGAGLEAQGGYADASGTGFGNVGGAADRSEADAIVGDGRSADEAVGFRIVADSFVGEWIAADSSVGDGNDADGPIGFGNAVDVPIGFGNTVDVPVGDGNAADSSVGDGNAADSSVGDGNAADEPAGSGNAADSPVGSENAAAGAFESLSAADAMGVDLDRREPLLVLELDNPILAAEVKLRLQTVYPDEHRVCFRDQSGAARWIPLYELDRQATGAYGHLAGVAIPALPLSRAQRYAFSDLLSIMRILRAPNGCPWDREQTHATIAMAAVEEAYEVLEAIQSGDPMRIADELGDLLLQAVFHAQIGADHGDFDITDVITAICHKMITRHRHIFGTASADTPEDVLDIWDAVKKTEKGHVAQSDVLLDVPRCFPALLRAQKLQKKAWRDPDAWPAPVLLPSTPFESVGSALFELVRNARLQGVSPEEALSWANDAFIHRYHIAEQRFAEGESFYEASPAAVGEIWRKGG